MGRFGSSDCLFGHAGESASSSCLVWCVCGCLLFFSFVYALAIGCVPGLSYHMYSVGILVTVGCSCYARGILEVVRCGGREPLQHSRGLFLGLRVQKVACTAEMAVRARSAFFGLFTLVGSIVEISYGIMGLLGIMTSGQVDLWGGNNRPPLKSLPSAAAASMVPGSCLEATRGFKCASPSRNPQFYQTLLLAPSWFGPCRDVHWFARSQLILLWMIWNAASRNTQLFHVPLSS